MRATTLRIALLLAGFSAFMLATPAFAADVSGTWSASAVVQQNGQIVYTTTPLCTFQQSGDQLTGMCKGPHAAGPISGTANGTRVTWRWEATANATDKTGVSNWTGTLDADGVIRGHMSGSAMPGVTAPFTAQRQ